LTVIFIATLWQQHPANVLQVFFSEKTWRDSLDVPRPLIQSMLQFQERIASIFMAQDIENLSSASACIFWMVVWSDATAWLYTCEHHFSHIQALTGIVTIDGFQKNKDGGQMYCAGVDLASWLSHSQCP
jgi:hypothetical protein